MTESILALISFYFLIFFGNRKSSILSLVMTVFPLLFYIYVYECSYPLLVMIGLNTFISFFVTFKKYKNLMSINLYTVSLSWLLVLLVRDLNFFNFVFFMSSTLLLNLLLTNEKVIEGKMYNFEVVKVVNIIIMSFCLLFLMSNELKINSISLENSYLFKTGFLLMNLFLVGIFGSYSNTSNLYSMLGKYEKATFMFTVTILVPFVSLTGLKEILDYRFFSENIDILVLLFIILSISTLYLNYIESFRLNSPTLVINNTCIVFLLELISSHELNTSFLILLTNGLINLMAIKLMQNKKTASFSKAIILSAPFTPLFFYKVYTIKTLVIDNLVIYMIIALATFINLFFYKNFRLENEV